jgi:hypothetical protein
MPPLAGIQEGFKVSGAHTDEALKLLETTNPQNPLWALTRELMNRGILLRIHADKARDLRVNDAQSNLWAAFACSKQATENE